MSVALSYRVFSIPNTRYRLSRMKIATWNINGVRARIDRLTSWLAKEQPDVLCLQEIKTEEDKFPYGEIAMQGYSAACVGQKSYNGVALLAREPLVDVELGLAGEDEDVEARFIAATVSGMRVASVYVPNGRALATPSFAYKMRFYDRLAAWSIARAGAPTAILGDYNVAPTDADVYDPKAFAGSTHVSPEERAALARLVDTGLADALRHLRPDEVMYTWWDYRMLGFEKNHGLRIDHALLSPMLAARVQDVRVDREARKGSQPSDHAPLVVELADAG